VPALTPQEIAAAVLDHLPPCNRTIKNAATLSSARWRRQRERTVLALPLIIDGARARGFEFVPVYQLMGKTKADVMRVASTSIGPLA